MKIGQWLGFVCIALSAAAQPEPGPAPVVASDSPALPLETLVETALRQNPELQFFEAEITAALAGRRSAGLLANPELSASVGHKSVRDGGLSAEGVAWSASVVQPFEWPGRMSLRKAIANHDLDLAKLGYERFRSALAARVRVLAYDWFAAREKAAVAQEVAHRFQELRDVLVQRDPAGLTPLLETRVIEATELTMQRRASEAAQAWQSAGVALNQLRGSDPQALLAILPPELTFRPPEPVEHLLGLARTNNFELRARAVELAQHGARVALARNERFPGFSIGPTLSEERAGDRERVVGLGVSVPLPLWNRNKNQIDAAGARRLQAEVALNLSVRDVERQVLEAAYAYQAKRREMETWRTNAVGQFREAAELADRHYRLGAVPVSTYVELQKQYLEAVESVLDTRREALEAAQNIELLTGLTPPLASTTVRK